MEASGKKVALVLSSGGPRGFAYIGAIEELEARGYRITSVAGTSIGSLIGGMYAAGKLEEIKDWLFSLDAWKVFALMDLSISMNHLVKGDKVIEAMKTIVPDINIEDLEIPYKAVATDFYTGEEVIFDRGHMFQAIRASISIPSLFRPVKIGTRTLIDGGIVNTLPLDIVDRTEDDILVGIDVNDVDIDKVRHILREDAEMTAHKEALEKARNLKAKAVINAVKNNGTMSIMEKFKLASIQGQEMLKHAMEPSAKQDGLLNAESSYYKILTRTFSLMNHTIAKLAVELTPPDILVSMPFDAFGEISDYAKAREISEMGREMMADALDRYEHKL